MNIRAMVLAALMLKSLENILASPEKGPAVTAATME
jgi:hypothetical protein